MIKLIGLEESATYPGRYTLSLNYAGLHLFRTEGSFNIIGARLVGMSYPSYLRYCRDVCGAELVGKGHKYVVPYFAKTPAMAKFLQVLNENANRLMFGGEGK